MTSRWLPAVVAVPFLAAALLAVVFDVAREIPPNYGCGEDKSPGLDARVDAYRQGYIPLHALAVVSALAALVWISAARMRLTGRSGIGRLMALTLALLVGLFVAAAVSEEARVVFLAVVFPALGLVVVAQAIGPVATGVLAALLLLAGAAWAWRAAQDQRSLLAVSFLCWLLMLLVPAHALIVSTQGTGPLFC